MDLTKIRLHGLGLGLKVAVTCLILILAGGFTASLFQMIHHYENKDEDGVLSLDDLIGSFHGLDQPSKLKESLQGSMREHVPSEAEHQLLMKWLAGNRISEDYDSLELGDDAPAEILARNCMQCHSREAAQKMGGPNQIALEYWEDVKNLAFAKHLDPVPLPILVTSTHTHALTMSLVVLVVAGLFLAAGFPRRFARFVVMLTFLALLADLGSWWLAREWEVFCYVLAISGGVMAGLCGLQLLGAFLGTWFRFPARD